VQQAAFTVYSRYKQSAPVSVQRPTVVAADAAAAISSSEFTQLHGGGDLHQLLDCPSQMTRLE